MLWLARHPSRTLLLARSLCDAINLTVHKGGWLRLMPRSQNSNVKASLEEPSAHGRSAATAPCVKGGEEEEKEEGRLIKSWSNTYILRYMCRSFGLVGAKKLPYRRGVRRIHVFDFDV